MAGPSDEEAGEHRGGQATRFLPLGRLTAFADGVFAIAITLLVLEIPVPEVETGLWSAIAEEWPSFLAYLVSFAFIGGIWMRHSGITKLTRNSDSTLFGLNLVLLFMVSLMPFTTKLMATHLSGESSRMAVVVYGINLLVATAVLSVIMWYTAKNPDLVVDDIADEELKATGRRLRLSLVAGALGVAIGLVIPLAAVAFYFLQTILIFVLPLVSARRYGRDR